jgi:hypothetical protein
MIGRWAMVTATGALIAASAVIVPAAASPTRSHAIVATDISAQNRPPVRRARARPRIEVRPLLGPLRRDCHVVFQERWIPQWGGSVLYAGQDCHWTRAPL